MSLRRIGLANDTRKDLRICNKHAIEEVSVSVAWTKDDNTISTTTVSMHLPSASGMATIPSSSPIGNGVMRNIRRQISSTQESAENGDEAAVWRLMMLYSSNNNQPEPAVKKRRLGIKRSAIVEDKNKKVSVRLDDTNDDKKIKIQTGFPSLLSLLGYIAVVTKGNIAIISTSLSTLTWFEEWYLFLEIIYGRSMTRWIDVEAKYNVSSCTLRKIYDNKIKTVLLAKSEWPLYASYNEDITYRKEGKWDGYESKRVIMFDNTDIIMQQPTDAEAQRSTYSLYYSGNVGKGAVHIQPCGWIGGYEIWTGGVSDTYYMQHGKVFDSFNTYLLTSTNEDDSTRDIPFTVVLDKGYRVVLDAFRNGGHFVLQPIFAQHDRQFTTGETLHSATVATDRAGNERAVKYLKISKYIKTGLLTNESAVRMCDTWLAWGFQVNFMYKSVQ
jgi:hypothetical protein